jgi:acyl carrier protein
MNTLEGFVDLVRDELGLRITAADVGAALDEVPGWDSLQLLELLAVLERETGRQMPLAEMLTADSLQNIYELALRT